MSFRVVSQIDRTHLLMLQKQSSSSTSSLTASPTNTATGSSSELQMHLEESNQFYQKLHHQLSEANDKIRIEEQRQQQLQRLQREQQRRKQAGKIVKTVKWTTATKPPAIIKPSSYDSSSSHALSLLWPWRLFLLVALVVQVIVFTAPYYTSSYSILQQSPHVVPLLAMDVDIMRNQAEHVMSQNEVQKKKRRKFVATLMGPFRVVRKQD